MSIIASDSLVVVITGPESCGKSTLANQLSQEFGGQWVPEYARIFVESLNRYYEYKDVEHIARHQYDEFIKLRDEKSALLFFDTYLIITKVWFTHVYKRYPIWLDEAIRNSKVDLFMLCTPELVWVSDSVRENGHLRDYLFEQYKKELEQYGFNYVVVSGEGEDRILLAKEYINQLLKSKRIPHDTTHLPRPCEGSN